MSSATPILPESVTIQILILRNQELMERLARAEEESNMLKAHINHLDTQAEVKAFEAHFAECRSQSLERDLEGTIELLMEKTTQYNELTMENEDDTLFDIITTVHL
jgi:hypothetical protein